ncbi:hypothetical protein Lepto7376_0911 [[Leptolyngbya] sp. PCC 7376]|uniref:PTPA-CTERM sorting domain-containing protein n=1 Tax=[Leptolyngbya] sp. PCC 7376 TaxID=111781 RepID=UPI00029EEC26|nr:PTPA-CTERM sorting domain-containing protein [[Leptolyngbya] sp. PCC 7376]AFY37285.1 hypothetical protein Lepto7376_0911 [[Leptolyngbya] sp. PCC 7376]
MSIKKLLGLGLVATGAIASSLIVVKPAEAFVIKDGWNYEIDVYNDATPVRTDGSSAYELYGMAYKVSNGIATIAINSNMVLEDGYASSGSEDGRLDFGDLLINFSGDDLQTASANADLFGIRFAPNSDSGVAEIGVYEDVTAQLAPGNFQWDSLQAYNDVLAPYDINPSIGDGSVFNNIDDYFGGASGQPLNSIASGNKIGDIEMLSPEEIASLGLDFGYFHGAKQGNQTIAFSFDYGLLPAGSALYHLGFECNNDVIGGEFEGEAVPTPAAILPAILGMFGAASRKKNSDDEQLA